MCKIRPKMGVSSKHDMLFVERFHVDIAEIWIIRCQARGDCLCVFICVRLQI